MVFFKLMNSLRFLLPVVAVTLLPFSAQAQETALQSEPFGYVKVSIPGAHSGAKAFTVVSLPLLEEATVTGSSSGRITGITSNTITSLGAGWLPGELSQVASPFLIEVTSGEAAGLMLLISSAPANTESTVQVKDADANPVDLTTLGITVGPESGDTFKIRPVDTLASFFGTPQQTGIVGGTNARDADVVTIGSGSSLINCYYDTGLARWTQARRSLDDASHIPLMPYSAMQYARVGETPLEFIVTGKVPEGPRRQAVRDLGSTFLAQFWPVGTTLGQMGLENMTGWRRSSDIKLADRVVVFETNGVVTTHYHDGSSWREARRGGALSGALAISAGQGVILNRVGSAEGLNFSILEQLPPYTLR
jgi:hypothetical protein